MKRAALLRGVNLGKRQLAMADLRAFFLALGFTDVKTLIASGNVAFEGGGEAREVEALLEREAEARLGFPIGFHVRDAAALDAAIAANPFPDAAAARPSFTVVTFYRDPIDGAMVERLRAAHDGPERMAAAGRELFVDYPHGQGRSTLDRSMRRCGWPDTGTARNWNTLLRVRAMLD